FLLVRRLKRSPCKASTFSAAMDEHSSLTGLNGNQNKVTVHFIYRCIITTKFLKNIREELPMKGMGNMGNMMKQMQKMQKKMKKAQDELHEMNFESSAGG